MSQLERAKRANDYFGFCVARSLKAYKAYQNGEVDYEEVENADGATYDARSQAFLELNQLKRSRKR